MHVKSLTHVRLLRIGLSVILTLLLFGATLYNEQAYHVLDSYWQRTTIALGADQHLLSLPLSGSAISQVMRRPHSIPAVLLYSVLYIGICLALLFTLLPIPRQRRLVLLFYGLTGVVSILLLLGSKVGSSTSLTILNSQLIHFVVSPLPVIMLAPLLRWYASNSTISA